MNEVQIAERRGNEGRLAAQAARLVLLLLFLSGCSLGATLPAQTAAPSTSASLPLESTHTPSESPLPACTSPAALTPALTEGPYYTPNSPERLSLLEDSLTGTVLVLSGYVLTPDCQPVAHAWLDFWQADANGVYDNSGYTLRGHQFTDENGYYQLTTVVPGIYPGRTEHIHFKAQAPEKPVLTSQLFFPGVTQNSGDSIFDPALVITITGQGSDTIEATFNFIVNP